MPKKKRPKGEITPGFPEFREDLIPAVSVKGEAPPATNTAGSFLPGFACDQSEAPAALSARARKYYEAFIGGARWKEKRAAILARANGYCESCREACNALEVHHRC